MKRLLLSALLLSFSLATYAQAGGSGFGLKAGLNFNTNGDLRFDELPDISPDAGVGFHVGVWGRLGGVAYVRPELVYTEIRSDYEGDTFKMRKIDLPILFGHRFLGIFHGYIGPALQFILDTGLEDISLGDIEKETTLGFQIGGGLNLGKLGIDLRYERGFSPNFIDVVGDVEGIRLDTRPSQIILGLSYKL